MIYMNFPQKTGFDILCKLSPRPIVSSEENLHEMSNPVFLNKLNPVFLKKNISMSSAENFSQNAKPRNIN